MRFWAIVDDDETIELYVRREDAERFLEEVRADDTSRAGDLAPIARRASTECRFDDAAR